MRSYILSGLALLNLLWPQNAIISLHVGLPVTTKSNWDAFQIVRIGDRTPGQREVQRDPGRERPQQQTSAWGSVQSCGTLCSILYCNCSRMLVYISGQGCNYVFKLVANASLSSGRAVTECLNAYAHGKHQVTVSSVINLNNRTQIFFDFY